MDMFDIHHAIVSRQEISNIVDSLIANAKEIDGKRIFSIHDLEEYKNEFLEQYKGEKKFLAEKELNRTVNKMLRERGWNEDWMTVPTETGPNQIMVYAKGDKPDYSFYL